jgi:putative ABC transport system permease protein
MTLPIRPGPSDDLGRRRVLGATRGTIALVTLRTLAPAHAGVLLGSSIGTWLAHRAHAVPPLEFTLATATLALVCAVASAIPPALFAATLDPVRVLRTAYPRPLAHRAINFSSAGT